MSIEILDLMKDLPSLATDGKQMFVITEHMDAMPDGPVGVCDSEEQALACVAKLAKKYSDDTKKDFPNKEEHVWVTRKKKDIFLCVKKSIQKKHEKKSLEFLIDNGVVDYRLDIESHLKLNVV